MPKRNYVLRLSLKALVAAVAGFVMIGICWNLLSSVIYAAETAKWEMCKEPNIRELSEAVAMLFCLGTLTGAASSVIRIMRPVIGGVGVAAASLGVLIALAQCVADYLQPPHMLMVMGWRWEMAVGVVAVLGSLFGVLLAGQRRGAKALWLPAAVVSAAALVLWLVYIPAVRFLMDMFITWQ